MITVGVIFRNEEKYLGKCIISILDQTYRDFELILLNDASTDNSESIVRSFKDTRIIYLKNIEPSGISKSRNICVKNAKGKYIFFSDADCTVDKNWIMEGLKYFEKGYLGVEGKTLVMSGAHTILNKATSNLHGGQWMTRNMAYNIDIINKLNGFDEKFGNTMEDRDLALRVLKHGEIFFNKNMLAYHAIKTFTFKILATSFRNIGRAQVYLYKKHRDKRIPFYFIIQPTHLLVIIFPPLLLYKLYRDKARGFRDIQALFFFYIGYIIQRYWIWKTAFEEKVFVI